MAVSLVSEFGRWSFPAGATNLVQFQFVSLNASGQIVMPVTGTPCVVLDDAPALTAAGAPGPTVVGANYSCVFHGIVKVIAGATITPGQQITADTSGHAIVASGVQAVQGYSFASCVSGDLVPIYLNFAGIF